MYSNLQPLYRCPPLQPPAIAWNVWVAGALLVVAFASRVVWFGDAAAESDEQLYSLIGAGLLEGLWPYSDLWDRKPFGLFALFALAHAFGGPGPLAYQLLATGFAWAGAWLVYVLARGLADRRTALGAGALSPLLLYAYGSFSGQSEVFFIPFLLGSLVLVRDMPKGFATNRAAAAMLLAGTALQIKYSVLPQCAFLGLIALARFRKDNALKLAGKALLLVGLGLLPTLAVAAIYAVRGEFAAFWFANFVSIFERGGAASGRFPAEHLPALTPLIALTAGGAYAFFRSEPRPPQSAYLLIVGWSVAVLAGIYMLGNVYLYYFAALVPAVILIAVPLLDVRQKLGWVPLAAAGVGAALLLNLPRHWAMSQQGRADLEQMSAKLAPFVSDQHCLLVFDGPMVLYRSTRSCLPTRYIYSDHLNNPLEQVALGVPQHREVMQILAARPGAIVVAQDTLADRSTQARRQVADVIAARYRPIAVARIRDRTILAFAPTAVRPHPSLHSQARAEVNPISSR